MSKQGMSRRGASTIGRVLLIFVAFMVLSTLLPLGMMMLCDSGLTLPRDVWTPQRHELGGGFVMVVISIVAGAALLGLAGKLTRPGVASMGVSRIWGLGFFLASSGIVLLLRYLFVLVLR